MSTWKNRIIGHAEVEPEQLLANPLNFRRHPGEQRDALRDSLGELGWVKEVLVNKRTGYVLDGHARVEEAMRNGALVPVTYVDISPEEERLALAVLDPITEMATRDQDALNALLADVPAPDGAGLTALLASLAQQEAPPEDGKESDESTPDSYQIVIDCGGESEQADLLTRLTGEGLKCRALTASAR